MSDSYGKIVAIFISVILMIIAPVIILVNHQKNTASMYLYTETVKFCEDIMNTGHITDTKYDLYSNLLAQTSRKVSGRYSFNISIQKKDGMMITNDEIIDALNSYSDLSIEEGDFIRTLVYEDGNNRSVVFYGGMIKYNEDD